MNDDPVKLDYDSILHGATKRKEEETVSDVIEMGKCVVVYPKGAKAVDLECGSQHIDTMQFQHICHHSRYAADGQSFWFVFGTMEKHRVTVYGRRLRDVYNRMADHCVRRLRAADRKFDVDESVPFIWKIEVKLLPSDWKEED